MLKLSKHTRKTNNTVKINAFLTILRFASIVAFAQLCFEAFLFKNSNIKIFKKFVEVIGNCRDTNDVSKFSLTGLYW